MAKTVKIEALINRANHFFYHSGDAFRGERKGMQSLVESFLHDCNRYRGFGYLSAEQSKPGHSVGIIFDAEGGKHQYPDDSRIRFI